MNQLIFLEKKKVNPSKPVNPSWKEKKLNQRNQLIWLEKKKKLVQQKQLIHFEKEKNTSILWSNNPKSNFKSKVQVNLY
jgi:hypothetical protein